MTVGAPSFYQLYRRSRYSSWQDAELEGRESEQIRRDRERFAAAALAFTLKHSAKFRRQFWKGICRVQSDPVQMPDIAADGIHIEPPHWADLMLFSKSEKFVWVVEIKIGAGLQKKQNPNESEFRTPGSKFGEPGSGYGNLFKNYFKGKNTKLRYILLCLEEDQIALKDSSVEGIEIQVKSWSDVANLAVAKNDSLAIDLFHSLGNLSVIPFIMNRAKKISVTRGLRGIGQAHFVLEAVCEWLGVNRQQRVIEPFFREDEGVSGFGVRIRRGRKDDARPRLRKLQKLTQESECLAWIGYGVTNKDQINREAWIYCSDANGQRKILRLLERSFDSAQESKDGDSTCVWVKEDLKGEEEKKDFDWFTSVFDTLSDSKKKCITNDRLQ